MSYRHRQLRDSSVSLAPPASPLITIWAVIQGVRFLPFLGHMNRGDYHTVCTHCLCYHLPTGSISTLSISQGGQNNSNNPKVDLHNVYDNIDPVPHLSFHLFYFCLNLELSPFQRNYRRRMLQRVTNTILDGCEGKVNKCLIVRITSMVDNNMNVGANPNKLRSYNCSLALLHSSTLLIVICACTNTSLSLCTDSSLSYRRLMTILSISLLITSFLCTCYVYFRHQFGNWEFYAVTLVEVLQVLAMFFYTFMALRHSEKQCIQVLLLEKWIIFASAKILVEIGLISVLSLRWGEYLMSGLGNLTWSFMFLRSEWLHTPTIKPLFTYVGNFYLIAFIILFSVNIYLRFGTARNVTIFIQQFWFFMLITMIGFGSFAGWKLKHLTLGTGYYELGGRILLKAFFIGNIIDLMFYVLKFVRLRVQNGRYDIVY